jgi:transcriptional regulator with XRE-family HTH domain
MERSDRKTKMTGGTGTGSSSAQNAQGIGLRLREVRQAKGLSVRELARRASVSASLVSQVELGRITPSVSTLYAIAQILNLSIDKLFMDAGQGEKGSNGVTELETRPTNGPIQRASSRQAIQLASGVVWERLTTMPDEEVEFLYVTYDVGGASCPKDAMLRHGGKEYGYLASGRLGLQIGFDEYELSPGDSFSFNGHTPHRIWAIGEEPATAIWVVLNRHGDDKRLLA